MPLYELNESNLKPGFRPSWIREACAPVSSAPRSAALCRRPSPEDWSSGNILALVVSNVFLRSFFLNHSKPHHCDENPPSAAQDSCDVTFGRQRRTLVGEDLTEKDFLQPAWQELQRWTRQSGEVPLLLEAGWGGCWPRSWRWAGTWGRPWRWRRAECKMSRIAGKKKGKVF